MHRLAASSNVSHEGEKDQRAEYSRQVDMCASPIAVACPSLHYTYMQVFKEAQDLMPGGVNSPVRAFRSVGGSPIIFESVKVSMAWCSQQQLGSSVNRALASHPGTGDMPRLLRACMHMHECMHGCHRPSRSRKAEVCQYGAGPILL